MLTRRFVALVALLVPACFHPSYDHLRCGENGECPSGLTCSAQQVCEFCIGSIVRVCRQNVPPNFALLRTINTDTDSRCDLQDQGPGAPQLCVMAGNDIVVDAQITAIGSHPLVLAAFHDLNITSNGNLVLTSQSGQAPGAGANDSACHVPTAGGDTSKGSGGGAGGSFGGPGGAGGNSSDTPGGTAGAPIAPISRVIGGCKGSPGGNVYSTPGGDPGNGGGAVMLLAANVLTLAGGVTAGGGGGLPAMEMYLGGGGGGSGGFVGLDAMIYAITGQVTANGGGGASGWGDGSTQIGLRGTDGTSSITMAASGGGVAPQQVNRGGIGGSGSIAAQPDGRPGQSAYYGGGGGGGGAGVILVKGAAPGGGAYSPPLTVVP